MAGLTPQVTATLKSLFDMTRTSDHAFANAKSNHIRSLVGEKLIEGNPQIVDPTNRDKHAFRLTAAGYTALGEPQPTPETPPAPATPDPSPAVSASSDPSTAGDGADTGLTPIPPGVVVTQLPAGASGTRKRADGTPVVPRGPNRPMEQVYSGVRMALPGPLPTGKRGGNRGETYAFSKCGSPITDEATKASTYDSFFVGVTTQMPTTADLMKTLRAAVFSANKRYKEKPDTGGIVRKFACYPTEEDTVEKKAGVRVFRVA